MFSSIPSALHFLSPRQKWVFFTLVSIRALSGILDVIGIALIGLIAGIATTSFQPGSSLTILGYSIPKFDESFLFLLVVAVLLLFVSKALIAILLGKSISNFLARIESEKALLIVEDIFGGDLQRVNSLSKGHILWTVTGSTNVAFTAVLMAFTSIVSEGVLLLLIATTFAFVDPVATVFVFVYFGVVIFGLQLVISRSLRRVGRGVAEGNVESVTSLENLLSAYREAKVLGKVDFFINQFSVARKKTAVSNATMIFLSGMPRYVVETALIFGVVIFVGFQFFSGQLSQGFVIVGVFLTGGVRIMASLLPLQAAMANLKSQSEQAKAAIEYLTESTSNRNNHEPSVSKSIDVMPRAQNAPIGVYLEGISYSYQDADMPALMNISLNVNAGQHVAIIGPSGAGKTTLVDILLGLVSPTEGNIRYFENDGSTIDLEGLTGRISYVPQKPGMISGTVAENVALGSSKVDIDEARVIEALKIAELFEIIDSLPHGIHSSIGAQSNALSGGQIQRLGLARALYEKPDLIVLDEATSALDASSEAAITASLRAFGSDVTVLVIAHRLSTVQHSDVVFVMEQGALIAQGSFSELKKTVPMVAEYVRLMSFED